MDEKWDEYVRLCEIGGLRILERFLFTLRRIAYILRKSTTLSDREELILKFSANFLEKNIDAAQGDGHQRECGME